MIDKDNVLQSILDTFGADCVVLRREDFDRMRETIRGAGLADSLQDIEFSELTIEAHTTTEVMHETRQYEVLDSYGIPQFTGSLTECGVWIDPVLGIDFTRNMWGTQEDGRGIDDDRFDLQEDGSIIVRMHEGPGGIGGEMTIRPVQS